MSTTDPDHDVLGPDYTTRTIELAPDAEGEVHATLVKRVAGPDGEAASTRAVLYVHGFIDYFFQTHLAEFWADAGYTFYALDLRKYGRSLRTHHTPNYVTSLHEYDEELDAAVRIIREEDGHTSLTVMGHSTGGLIVSLWAHRRRHDGVVDALVLNSPWFDLNANLLLRTVGTAVIHQVGSFRPHTEVSKLGQEYGRALHVSTGGPWEYNLEWKPIEGFPVLAGWLRAIRQGHAELGRGLELPSPVFVACSTRSADAAKHPEAVADADVVLDVEHIARRSVKLGRCVTLVRITGGIHDLALSAEPARAEFFAELSRWERTYVPR
ncbi:hypothetical protein N865_12700 [Intrasporangium oryzae NRRL B-24470]|uniref:Serine aminopeptidase S33 domain-containing protein n=1 Tax=Intrasporangium oryzae NRRL B-24470 TaxID=1386089 RepID=W9GDG0_9MICO